MLHVDTFNAKQAEFLLPYVFERYTKYTLFRILVSLKEYL